MGAFSSALQSQIPENRAVPLGAQGVSFTCASDPWFSSVQFSRSVVSDSLRPHDRSTPGLPVHHQLPEFAQTHVHPQLDMRCKHMHTGLLWPWDTGQEGVK